MTKISLDNFDPLRRYIDVRMQMGVPLVDRDWNELADIRRFELRMFLKWFVGSGVPADSALNKSDVFKLEGNAQPNDFKILSGKIDLPLSFKENLEKELRKVFYEEQTFNYQLKRMMNVVLAENAGHCLVDGLEVFLAKDILFSEQELCKNKKLAERLGVPIPEIPNTSYNKMLAYLDVWEHFITPLEDPDHLILQKLGVESCARIKRDWVVRVRSDISLPKLGDDDYRIGHSYYALAILGRSVTTSAIYIDEDLRQIVSNFAQTNQTIIDTITQLKKLERGLSPAFASPPNEFWPYKGQQGISIIVFGKNFTVGDLTVKFDEVEAQIVNATDTQVVVVVPSTLKPSSEVNIEVITSINTTKSKSKFKVPPIGPLPSFYGSPNQFEPKEGMPGQEIELRGRFSNNYTYWIGTTLAHAAGYSPGIGPTKIRVPAMPPGRFPISVENEYGIVTSTDIFSVLASSTGYYNIYGYNSASSAGIGGDLI